MNGRLRQHAINIAVPIAWLLVVLLYCYHFKVVMDYAVNIPYWDEWYYFNPDALPAGLTWHWLLKFHNEHRIVLTKLLAWLNLQLFDLDFVKQIGFNFILFGLLLAAIYHLVLQLTTGDRLRLFPLFLIFLLSPLNAENHYWAFQSQFHLFMLFLVLAVSRGFAKPVSHRSAALFSVFTILALYSFSAGTVAAMVFLCFYVIYLLGNHQNRTISTTTLRGCLAISCGVIATGLVLWFQGYHKPPHHPALVFPWSGKFWEYFLNLVGFGFGYDFPNTPIGPVMGILCLTVVLLPTLLLLVRKDTRWSPATWTLATGIASILAILAAITMGRANLWELNESRYNEIGFMLIPCGTLAWWLKLRGRPSRPFVIGLVWLLCLAGYGNRSSFKVYEGTNRFRLEEQACIDRCIESTGECFCQYSFDRPVDQFIGRAQQLGAGFARKSQSGR